MIYLALFVSIVAEVIGTSLIKKTENFTVLLPTLGTLLAYLIAFYFLSYVMRVLPVGVVYATWSGLGIVLISLAAFFIYEQTLDLPAIIGIGLIIAGVLVTNLLSKSAV